MTFNGISHVLLPTELQESQIEQSILARSIFRIRTILLRVEKWLVGKLCLYIPSIKMTKLAKILRKKQPELFYSVYPKSDARIQTKNLNLALNL